MKRRQLFACLATSIVLSSVEVFGFELPAIKPRSPNEDFISGLSNGWSEKILAHIESDPDSPLNKVEWAWWPDGIGTQAVRYSATQGSEFTNSDSGADIGFSMTVSTYYLEQILLTFDPTDSEKHIVSEVKEALEVKFWCSCDNKLPIVVDPPSYSKGELVGFDPVTGYSLYWHPECFSFMVPRPLIASGGPKQSVVTACLVTINGESKLRVMLCLAVKPICPSLGYKIRALSGT